MARRHFGTDGVRGIVGEELTPDLVEQIGKAATLWARGRTCARRTGHAQLRAGARAGRRTRHRVGGRHRRPRRRPPDACSRAACGRPRRRRLGVAQPAGVQRREALPGRREARRRARGGDRGALRRAGARRRIDRVSRRRHSRLPRSCRRALRLGSHGPSDRRRLRERCVLRHRAACLRAARRGGAHDRSAARRLEHQRRLRRDRPSSPATARDLGGSRPRGRLRRRRRPHACRRRARRAGRRRSDHRRARAPPGRRPRSRHRHDEPRIPSADGRAPHQGRDDARRRSLRARSAPIGRGVCSAASSRAT